MDSIKRYHAALAAADKVIRENPEDPTAYHNRGVVLYKLGRFTEAVDSFHEAIRYKPNFARAYFNIARSMRSMGRYREAVNAYDAAAELKPNIPAVYDKRSAALIDLGASMNPRYTRCLFESAVEDAHKAIELSTGSEGYYNLACAKAHLGDLDGALEALAKCKTAQGVEFDAAHAWEDADFSQLRKSPYINKFTDIVGSKPESPSADAW